MPKKKNIVIVGGGFAGIRLCLDLQKHVYQDAGITLIDDSGFHEYTPNFYKIATTIIPEKSELNYLAFDGLRDKISIPIAEIIDSSKINLLIDRVVNIDAPGKNIRLGSGKTIGFDWLVLAAGSKPRFFNIPHLTNYAYVMKSANDAFNIRNAIHELFTRKGKHEEVRVLIVGGGFTGSELAAALVLYTKKMANRHNHPFGNVSVTIAEAALKIMPGASEWLSYKADKRLRQLGVRIVLNSPISNISQSSVQLKDGKNMGYDLLIWTAGVSANPLAFEITGAKLDEKSCLIVDDRLRVAPYDNIFAIGDMAFCSSTGAIGASMTAQVAIQQGRYLAHTLKRLLHKRATLPYYFHRAKLVVPLGEKYVLADLGWIKFAGFFAWCLECLIAFRYLTTILLWRRAITRWKQNI